MPNRNRCFAARPRGYGADARRDAGAPPHSAHGAGAQASGSRRGAPIYLRYGSSAKMIDLLFAPAGHNSTARYPDAGFAQHHDCASRCPPSHARRAVKRAAISQRLRRRRHYDIRLYRPRHAYADEMAYLHSRCIGKAAG